MRLVLASSSPRRAELLSAAGYVFEISAVEVDERVHPGEAAADYVRRLASEKSADALARLTLTSTPTGTPTGEAAHLEELVVLGADTAVVVDGVILGKPGGQPEAAAMLNRLSAREHEVMTGVSVRRTDRELSRVETSRVRFAALTPEEIAWYVATGEGEDKAGSYAIQGLAARFVTGLDGSRSNVIGLPVETVRALLAAIGSDEPCNRGSGALSL